MKKKILSIFLAVVMIFLLLPVTALAATVTKPEGATWLVENQVWCQFTDTDSDTVMDTLTIGGEGAMPDWTDTYGAETYNTTPWWTDKTTFV